MRNLVYRICLHHYIAEMLLKLALNTSQSIIPTSSNSLSLFQLSCATSDINFKLLEAVSICLWDSDYHISIFKLFWFYSVCQYFVICLHTGWIPRTSDGYDNPLTSCSIPYTDLRAIIMNWIYKRWQDSWDHQINKFLVIHAFVDKILCSYGQ